MKRTAIAVVVAIALTATVTAAAATSSSSTVKGCWNLKTRVLTLRAGSSCSSGTRAIEWNVTGPKGIQGKQGLRGSQGIQGKQGTPGEAMAWASVNVYGLIEASTPNVTSVVPDVAGVTGLFCVNLSITNAQVATVTISDGVDSGSITGTSGWVATAEVIGLYDATAGCANGVSVQTYVTTTGTNGSVTGHDEGFFLMVD